MKRLGALVFVTLMLASAAADAKKKRVVVDRIVAVVNDSAITKSALDREVLPLRREIERAHALDADARAKALRQAERERLRDLIDMRLLLQAAGRARLRVAPEEIDRALAELAKQSSRTVPELLQAIAREGYEVADYRRRVGEQIVSYRLAAAEAARRRPDWAELGIEEQRAIVTTTMKTLVSELRNVAHIEERL